MQSRAGRTHLIALGSTPLEHLLSELRSFVSFRFRRLTSKQTNQRTDGQTKVHCCYLAGRGPRPSSWRAETLVCSIWTKTKSGFNSVMGALPD